MKKFLLFFSIFFAVNMCYNFHAYKNSSAHKNTISDFFTGQKNDISNDINNDSNKHMEEFDKQWMILVVKDVSFQVAWAIFMIWLLFNKWFKDSLKDRRRWLFLLIHFLLYASFLYSVSELHYYIKKEAAYHYLEERFSGTPGFPQELHVIVNNERIKSLVLKDVVFQGLILVFLFIFFKIKDEWFKKKDYSPRRPTMKYLWILIAVFMFVPVFAETA